MRRRKHVVYNTTHRKVNPSSLVSAHDSVQPDNALAAWQTNNDYAIDITAVRLNEGIYSHDKHIGSVIDNRLTLTKTVQSTVGAVKWK